VALNYVTVTGTFDDGSGNPLPLTGQSAYALFTPSTSVFANGIPVITPASPIQAPISGGTLRGELGGSLSLLATDNSGLTYGGLTGFFYWTVQVFINGQAQPSWSFFLPHTPSPVDLTALANTSGGGGGGATLPLTTLGDTLYENATPAAARLPGNTTAVKQFLTQTGTGSVSAAPAWGAIQAADLPFQPWQFNVKAYGAKGDGKVITDATIAGGALSTLTSASAAFTSADTGKVLVLSSPTPQFFTITFVNSTTVTLNTAAAGAVTGIGAIYGTDDTAAIQSAVNAAVTYAQGSVSQFAEVLFPPAYYMVAGNPVKGATLGNAQITLPVISASSGTKVNLKLAGLSDVTAAPEHWLQVTHNAPGSVLVCANGSGTYDGAFGPSCMIGGPVNGYGGSGGTFSNMQVTLEGLTCLLPYTTTIGGINLFGVGQMWVKSFSVMPMGVAASGAPWPQLASGGPVSNFYPSGLITPAVGNNARNDIDYYTCYGQHTALAGADHLSVKSLRTIFCNIGWLPTCVTSFGQNHAASIGVWCCEATANPVVVVDGGGAAWAGYNMLGYASVNVAALGLETFSSGLIVAGDTSGFLTGIIRFENLSDGGGSVNQVYHANLTDNLTVKLLSIESNPGPVASPHAIPASGTPLGNYYYRDAYVVITGGNVTGIAIDGVAAGLTSGMVMVPSGHSITLTYTVAPTWMWVLL
jgi:hypothetical protein